MMANTMETVLDFEREVHIWGSSNKFMSLLEERSKDERDIPIKEVAKKRGIVF